MSKEISLEEVKKFWPQSAPDINNIKKYVKKYQDEKIVIKYGGNVLIDKDIFSNFIDDINILNKLGLSIVVVHGGGPRIKRELDKSNIQTKFIRGLRVTDKKIIKIIENVLIDFNNDIVIALKEKGLEAISINTKTNNIINVIPEKEELGFVGIPNKINTDIIKGIIEKNQIPVVAPLGLGKNNDPYNINGDTAAGAIAKSLNARRLLLMTNVEGVLDKEKKLIAEISSSKILEMIKNEIITGGMIPKINTCLDAVNKGVRGVVIMDGRKNHSILNEIFSDAGVGTLIR
ncbi:acetylglutamate kinase [Pelagibacteraceae bacterium]|nr:acetylglutamate kinase [Pelagibacteraceae bacterium]MDC0339868.1 acetylglutamate kinase [Pelagibacteraceae bacterium]MDC0366535.1 acetylglutamate kinase [Pelagibacteraceae bacterium]